MLLVMANGDNPPGLHPTPQPHPFDNWSEWQPLNLNVSYFNLTRSPDEPTLQLWFTANFQGVDSLIRLEGPDPLRLNRVPPQFDTRLVEHYPRDLDGIPHPILSRTSTTRLQDGTLLVLGSIGPRYSGGHSELFPVLFLKKPNQNWEYLGPPSGEPKQFLDAAAARGATVRCEGAGIVQLPDGTLRFYAHGMLDPEAVPDHLRQGRIAPNTLLVAEAERPEGPWTFLRDETGAVLNLFANTPIPWVFPHVQTLDDQTIMLTGADAWPPQAVYAAYSRDGLHFRFPADATENDDGTVNLDAATTPRPLRNATDISPDARFCKGLRGIWMPESQTFHAVMNISRPQHRGHSFLYAGTATLSAENLEKLFQAP